MTETAHNVDFFDRRTNDCPFPAYRQLRDDSPVWQDPTTGMFVLTRYDDIRAVEMDTKRFRNTISTQTVGEIGLSADGVDSKQRFESQQKNDTLQRPTRTTDGSQGPHSTHATNQSILKFDGHSSRPRSGQRIKHTSIGSWV